MFRIILAGLSLFSWTLSAGTPLPPHYMQIKIAREQLTLEIRQDIVKEFLQRLPNYRLIKAPPTPQYASVTFRIAEGKVVAAPAFNSRSILRMEFQVQEKMSETPETMVISVQADLKQFGKIWFLSQRILVTGSLVMNFNYGIRATILQQDGTDFLAYCGPSPVSGKLPLFITAKPDEPEE